jgi:hypothetical protein
MVLRNVGILSQHYTASHPRRPRLEATRLGASDPFATLEASLDPSDRIVETEVKVE